MFDVVGVLDLGVSGPQPTARLAHLPSEQWRPDQTTEIRTRRLQARFLELQTGNAYATLDDYHLFVVGEIRRRGQRQTCPLPATTVLAEYRRDPAALLRITKGNFVLVFIGLDDQRTTCELIASRLSISPFYYTLDDNRLIFSTSLAAVLAGLQRQRALDHAAVAELALFNYPLAARTYVQDVRNLRPAEIVRLDRSQLNVSRWWDIRELYEQPLLSTADALELGSELLHSTINDLARDQPRIRVSFTSGFDSRVTLAVLERDPAELLAYSFGTSGSMNVSVPLDVCAELGVAFEPIYLEAEYEAQFDEYALRTLLLSDCLSTVERANYPYAFERTAHFSPVVLTGLFGSELLRTFQNIGYIVSADLVRLHLSAQPQAGVRQLATTSRYFQPELLRDSIEEVESDVLAVFDERLRDVSADRRFYLFLLTEGLRKYFGAETHIERPWGLNRFPFLDEEFVDFAFRAPFAGVHARTLKPTIANRFRSQYFYTYVIRRYRPELLKATTDHGYAPADLLSPFALLRIGPRILAQRWRHRRSGYREFKTEEWTTALYERRLFQAVASPDIFAPRLRSDFEDGTWLEHRLQFAKAASLKLWLEQLAGCLS